MRELTTSLLALLLLLFSWFGAMNAALASGEVPAPPDAVLADIEGLELAGAGDFDVLFWDVYQAALWAEQGVYKPASVHALTLRYERDFAGKAIADRSLKEMRDIEAGSEAQRKAWHGIMLELFPDVAEGDRLTGVHYPGERSVFYKNEEQLGVVEDPEFGPAFFGIWLDENTNAPGLRDSLLANAQAATPASGSR